MVQPDREIVGKFRAKRSGEVYLVRRHLAAKYDANWHQHEAHSQPY